MTRSNPGEVHRLRVQSLQRAEQMNTAVITDVQFQQGQTWRSCSGDGEELYLLRTSKMVYNKWTGQSNKSFMIGNHLQLGVSHKRCCPVMVVELILLFYSCNYQSH